MNKFISETERLLLIQRAKLAHPPYNNGHLPSSEKAATFFQEKKKKSKQLILNKHKSFGALLTLPNTVPSCLWLELTGQQTLTDVTLTGKRNGNSSVTVQQALESRAHFNYSLTEGFVLVQTGSHKLPLPALSCLMAAVQFLSQHLLNSCCVTAPKPWKGRHQSSIS